MATLVLQAAGGFLGSFLGPVGAAIGSSVGAMAGYAVDRAILEGGRRIEGARMETMRPFTAEEGVGLPRVYGTMRLAGTLIWATRFQESATTGRQGGKGGPRVTNYSYSANAAFALCEGEIAGVRRIWADGREIDREQVEIRVYRGTLDQPADPLIEAKQGSSRAPAYRGTAYVVVDHLPLANFGNRLPQLQFEVIRPCSRLARELRSVSLIPGASEYGLFPSIVTRERVPGEAEALNRRVLHAGTDIDAALDELQAVCPALETIGLVVTWFGSDLRAGECKLRPCVAEDDASGISVPWKAGGLSRSQVPTVSRVSGSAAYGGTPSDRSVIEAIKAIRARGLKVMLHPFIMMDVPAGNGLPDPYGEAQQAAYPWRGRITCHPVPDQHGAGDKTAVAGAQVAAFVGGANIGDFSVASDGVTYAGTIDDWGFRRFILHHAHLAKAAGGVDAFLLGSEMRGVSRLRDETGAFPFVEAQCRLAEDVATVLGSATKLTYGADWSEYFGHQPGDGSGDVFFHLDPLWAHPAISAVAIHNYMPLADWRDGDEAGANPDGFREPHDLLAMTGQVSAGEGFDWFYMSDEDRLARRRTPIADGAAGKPWVFRYKDIASWWSNLHFDRPGGVEAGEPTSWQPRSKPVWFTEIGCPAVDKGPNQPNVFPDPKSSESAVPYFSSGARNDDAQQRFLTAHLNHWFGEGADARNPQSPIYGGPMVAPGDMCVWTWDARPFPAFPLDDRVWADAANWHSGHWINGRLSTIAVEDLIRAVLDDHGLSAASISAEGRVAGYVVREPATARAALEPLVELFGIGVQEAGAGLSFIAEAISQSAMAIEDMVLAARGAATVEKVRTQGDELPLNAELAHADPMNDFQQAIARAQRPGGAIGRMTTLGFSGALERGMAEQVVAGWIERKWVGRESISFSLPLTQDDIAPGHFVTLGGRRFIVTTVEEGLVRRLHARRVAHSQAPSWRSSISPDRVRQPEIAAGPAHILFLDLPSLDGRDEPHLRIAAHARPWRRQVIYASPDLEGFEETGRIDRRAIMGRVVQSVPPSIEACIDIGTHIEIELFSGALESISLGRLLAERNLAAMRARNGEWEVFQFAVAEEVRAGRWVLSGLVRARGGTSDAMAAGIQAGAPFVMLDASVVDSGVRRDLAGLERNWRVAAAGASIMQGTYANAQVAGGLRALMPLAPVHLRLQAQGSGLLHLSWIRRGRLDTDRWDGSEIPLGEETEAYLVELGRDTDAMTTSFNVTSSKLLIPADVLGAGVERLAVRIRQISAAVGPGLPAHATFQLS
jgi:hypothetical protein